MKWPVGTRAPIEGNTLAPVAQRTGRPARMDTLDNATGTLAELARAIGLRAAVAVPVIIDGRLWGLAAVGSDRPGPMPADNRGPHQPLRRTDRHCTGGRVSRRAEAATTR
jgi:GAF domain-containing protein